ncbi:MAG: hypothetical protein IJJ71_00225 [Treponema sp.]|uniref:hypothetical protein n=1 Tax=Treponema sp. TaxID=166 RepID=UPI0025E713F4|nr:hypothetical protein [Treponema sp.]MBQ9622724.1 hypothetical protein [Treponema sp.]MBR0100834.1 hypothetical protein [Treponema sp.]MBR0494585.1 hypothetical protein [Treponema sp.]
MKKHRLFSVLCVIPLLAFLSCSDDSDSSSDDSGANLFASPKTVIYYMDTGNSVSVLSTSRSARAAVTVETETIAEGDTIALSELKDMVDGDCKKSVLSGEETPVYAILDIVKNEIYNKVGNLAFDEPYDFSSDPVTATRTVNTVECDFTVDSFEARYTNGSETAYLYLTMGVSYNGAKVFDAVGVIKCTPNDVGTLDVSFYYEYVGNADVYSYVEFKVVSGKKTKIEYGIDNDESVLNPYWEKFEITASKISGYHYKTESGNSRKKAFVVNSADYCAVYSERSEDTYRAVHNTKADGSRIRSKSLRDTSELWRYYLPNLNIPEGYTVKKCSNYDEDFYLYKADNTKYRLYHDLRETADSEGKEIHIFALSEDLFSEIGVTSKISESDLQNLDVPTDSSAFPEEEKPDNTELKTLLAAWNTSAE